MTSENEPDKYQKQAVPRYRGNPFIEALPGLFSEAQVEQRLIKMPEYDPEQRSAPPEVRTHLLIDMMSFFLPLPRTLDLERGISRMLRDGYVARNPIDPKYWQKLDTNVQEIRSDLKDLAGRLDRGMRQDLGRTSHLNTTLIGISGIGKTVTVQELLSLYPQVIEHGSYMGFPLNIRQLVHLRLETPHRGNPRDLCLSFFREVDRLLSTNHENKFRKGTEYEMLANMTQVAGLHALGLLVIDEIQELAPVLAKKNNSARDFTGNAQALLAFFLRLTNTLNVPILLIGTYKAAPLFGSQLRHARRFSGQGIRAWGPLSEGPEWDIFIEAMWTYQYTRTPTPLSSALSDTLFFESQGICDFALKLYFLAQDRLITEDNENSTETITPDLIQQVARESLGAARDILQALRRKEFTRLESLEDIEMPSYEEMLQQLKDRRRTEESRNALSGQGQRQATVKDSDTSLSLKSAQGQVPDIQFFGKQLGKYNGVEGPKLIDIIKTDSNGNSAHKLLKLAGIIKESDEFLIVFDKETNILI